MLCTLNSQELDDIIDEMCEEFNLFNLDKQQARNMIEKKVGNRAQHIRNSMEENKPGAAWQE